MLDNAERKGTREERTTEYEHAIYEPRVVLVLSIRFPPFRLKACQMNVEHVSGDAAGECGEVTPWAL